MEWNEPDFEMAREKAYERRDETGADTFVYKEKTPTHRYVVSDVRQYDPKRLGDPILIVRGADSGP